jgi:hypothetical protein
LYHQGQKMHTASEQVLLSDLQMSLDFVLGCCVVCPSIVRNDLFGVVWTIVHDLVATKSCERGWCTVQTW